MTPDQERNLQRFLNRLFWAFVITIAAALLSVGAVLMARDAAVQSIKEQIRNNMIKLNSIEAEIKGLRRELR